MTGGLPTRIPSEFPGAFAVPPGTFEPGRVPLPPAPPDAAIARTVVRPQDLDPMGHVNNAAYLDYLEEALITAGAPAADAVSMLPRSIRLEYVTAAAAAEALAGAVWPDASTGRPGWAWRLTGGGDRELARGRVLAGT